MIKETYLEVTNPKLYEKAYEKVPIFDASAGVGTKWKYNNKVYTAKFSDGKRTREVTLKIRSWRGISPGAIHYYAKMWAHDLIFSDGEKSELSSTAQPALTKGFDIEIRRPLTQKEMDDEPDRWEFYDVGDYITGFEDKEELIAAANKIFKEKFKGKWKLVIDK